MNHQDKTRTRIYWQYKNSPKLIQLLMSLPDIAQSAIEDQLAKVKAMLDIDTAEGEQLNICGRIVGYLSRPSAKIYPSCVFGPVNDELFRTLIKAKIYRNNSIATIDEVKTAADYILNTETRCLDGQDMTMRMIWFSHDVSIPVQQLVRDYDLIPRPQGVGTREHRVLTYRPFGFGSHYSNFRAPFWHGDGLHLYYSVIFRFSFDNDAGILHGKLISEEVVIANLDVKLTITDADGAEKTVFAVTDENGEFSVQMEKTGRYTAVAQTQIITPDCAQAIVTSDPYNFRWHIDVTSITASVTELKVARGESAAFTVNVLPENASNKAFTVHLSDGTMADTSINGNQVTVFGLQKGAGVITITSEDTGMTTSVSLSVIIVSEAKFVMKIDSPTSPLFYLTDITEDFTIDYGDGIDGNEYTVSSSGLVTSTRTLTIGEEYTLIVKRSDTMRFFGGDTPMNPLLEIVRVSGDRLSMHSFARQCVQLRRIHAGAFDELEMCTDFRYALSECNRLVELPAGLFDKTVAAELFNYLCYNCESLAEIPDGMFSGATGATSFSSAFSSCRQLTRIPDELFAEMRNVSSFSGVFSSCTSLASVGVNIFRGCISATTFANAFLECTALENMPLFTDCNRVVSFSQTFSGCVSLKILAEGAFEGKVLVSSFAGVFRGCQSITSLPPGLFRGCVSATAFEGALEGCSALTDVAGDIFAGCEGVTALQYVFRGCTTLKYLPEGLLTDMVNVTSMTRVFHGCVALVDIPERLFRGNEKLVTVEGVFASCSALQVLPEGLFANNPLIVRFDDAFSGVGVEYLPERLFSHNLNAVTFISTFSNCDGLKDIPSGLFHNNVLASNFKGIFSGCRSLESVGNGIFDSTALTSLDNIFTGCINLGSSINDIFPLESYTAITTARSLFERCEKVTGQGLVLIGALPSVRDATRALYNCVSLNDYYKIPSEWK